MSAIVFPFKLRSPRRITRNKITPGLAWRKIWSYPVAASSTRPGCSGKCSIFLMAGQTTRPGMFITERNEVVENSPQKWESQGFAREAYPQRYVAPSKFEYPISEANSTNRSSSVMNVPGHKNDTPGRGPRRRFREEGPSGPRRQNYRYRDFSPPKVALSVATTQPSPQLVP
jgi:hypothetical protein